MGPATSSAVLAAADASIPFMSDDVMAVALPPSTGSSDTYSMPRLLQLAAKVGACFGLLVDPLELRELTTALNDIAPYLFFAHNPEP